MARWLAEGTDERSGGLREILVEARDEKEAVHLARLRGVCASRLELVVSAADRHEVRPAATGNTVAAVPKVPAYRGLLWAGRILVLLAMVVYVMAAGALVLTFSRPGFGQMFQFLWGGGLLLVAAAYHGLGSAAFALRDIARNSFGPQ